MYPFVESLRIENGVVSNLHYHNERMNRTRSELFGATNRIDLADHIRPGKDISLIKCRVEYMDTIRLVEYLPYEMRSIQTLQVVENNEIDYHYKSADRRLLNELFTQRRDCDDILIVRNGLLTDSFAANIALHDGTGWFTPAHPLLCGTRRAFLLENNCMKEKNIRLNELFSYQKISLFNAMIDLGQIEINIRQDVRL